MNIKSYVVILGVTLPAAQAFADAKDFYFRRMQERQRTWQDSTDLPNDVSEMAISPRGASLVKKSTAATFDQLIDHNKTERSARFKQRYFIDSRYAVGEDAPVFYYICGEATCTATDGVGSLRGYATKMKAHIVSLEHRYYGESQPFPEMTAANMKYLTTENALEDLAAFQRYAQSELKLKGKWIVVGGSYAGSLSAYYRSRFPDLVEGSLASSAPVRAHENFEEYDQHVSKVVGETCGAAMRTAVAAIDASLDNPAEMLRIKKLFQAEAVKDDLDFVMLVADIGATAAQYGFHKDFCAKITKGDALTEYGKFSKTIYDMYGVDAVHLSAQGAVSTDPKDYIKGFGMRSWLYQTCTEYGYWQNAYHDSSVSVRSSKLNMDYVRGVCKRIFGIDAPAATDDVNDAFYKPLLGAPTSQILFTNGSNDPWSLLSVGEDNGNTTNEQVSTYLIKGSAHCDDLGVPASSDSESLKEARVAFEQHFTKWLGKEKKRR